MGFMKRLLGGSDVTRRELNVTFFTRVRDEASLQVVGEAYRQGSVLSARSPSASDLPPGLPAPPPGLYKAMLVPEPTNAYDLNAIAVSLWAGGDWTMSGYLSRDDAVRYRPLFAHLATTTSGIQPAIACDAALVSERDGTGVVLHLGTPGECAVELATEDRDPSGHRWVEKPIVFTGQNATTIHGVPLDRPAQLMLAAWAGCVVLPRMTKATQALIVSNPGEATGNLQKAKTYGTEVVFEPDFLVWIGIPNEVIGRVTARWAAG